MGNEVYSLMDELSGRVQKASIATEDLFEALADLSNKYFTYKNLSTATKNVTQYTDEYRTRFSHYNELRRISLGYVIGVDQCIVSSESMRKRVEKSYLQNTDYWLAYAITAVMLWASNEKEAAQRALKKSLQMHTMNSCLFFLLINLRFGRIESAKKWYIYYLDLVDMRSLGPEWKYLLQAYLCGAFGVQPEFSQTVKQCFIDLISKIDLATVDYGEQFNRQARQYMELYPHQSLVEFSSLKRCSPQWSMLKDLSSTAEKNAIIAGNYARLLQEDDAGAGEDLFRRIEDVLYTLINDYDKQEYTVLRRLQYNEAVIAAGGDTQSAKVYFDSMVEREESRSTLPELLINWAFADGDTRVDILVKRFSISMMKGWISAGFQQFAKGYREKLPSAIDFSIDGWTCSCDENSYAIAAPQLEQHYANRRLPDTIKDTQVLIFSAMCLASLLGLIICIFEFWPAVLVISILVGLSGSFLLWRRIVDVGKILLEKKRQSLLLLHKALGEFGLSKKAISVEDAKNTDLVNLVLQF